jgi:hypothetical protein
MEVPGGNSLCHYFKYAKMSFLPFLYIENRRKEELLPEEEGLIPVGVGKRWGNGVKG